MTDLDSCWMPLHAAQEAVYFDQLRDPSCAKYNVGGYLRFRGRFDPRLFNVALDHYSRATPAERMEIDVDADVPRQRPLPVAALVAPTMLEFPSLADAQTWMQSRMDTAFDLLKPPLHEHAMLRIDAHDLLYFARYHHVVADAYSFALKIRRVVDLYLRLQAGVALSDPTADAAFRGEIDACLQYRDSVAQADDAAYWERKYAQVPPAVWPDARLPVSASCSAEAAVELPAESTRRLQELSREAGASPAHVLLGIVGIEVARCTGARDLVVGVPVHNRVYRKQKSLFGMFTTIMPSRITLDGASSFRQLVTAIAAEQNADMMHRGHPWAQLAHRLRAHDPLRRSLFDVAVNFERFMPGPEVAGLQITAHELASRQEDIPLHVKLCDFDGRQPQLLKIACTIGMLGDRSIEAAAAGLLASMADALANPDRTVDALLAGHAAARGGGHRFAGAPPAPELPLDRPRPLRPAPSMREIVVPVSSQLADQVAAVARRCAVSQVAVVFAAWSLLQARLSGEYDVISGLAMDGAVLPRRLNIDLDTDVHALLNAAADAVNDRCQPTCPQVRAMLVWQPVGSLVLPEGVDVVLAARHSASGLALQLGYADDRIDATTAQRWSDHLATLLDALTADASSRVGALPILTAAQRSGLLEGFNSTRADFPAHALIHELFEVQAARTPESVALECEHATLTYAHLNARANRMAHALRGAGVGPDRLVAICAERGIGLVVAMLAVLKAGGAYVPLDPAYPLDRLHSMLDDAEPVLVLSARSCRERVPAMAVPVWLLDDEDAWARQPATNPYAGNVHSHHLAYVIFTSGSTGRPKGVMVEHRSVIRLVVGNDFASIGPDDCIAQCASPAFDAATWEVWGSLLHGARLLVVPVPVLLDPAELNRCFVDRGVTALFITVALFNEYVEPMAEAFGRLKYLLVGGDVLDPRKIEAVVNSARPPRWFKACYGPTETTTFASMHPVAHVVPGTRSIPLGTPITNTTIYVLDAQRQPVPIGVCGELYIGGPGVARGYLKRPDLTKEKFVPDPFGDDPDGRLYRTGDLGCYRPDGAIDFRGRNDFQVKIRGFRVETTEVEVQLFEKAPVSTCAVLALEAPGRGKYLAAWVVPQAGRDADCEPSALRALLSASMPDYMVPSVFFVRGALPMTANGKIDRAALRAAGAQPAGTSSAYVAPATAVQRVIASTWAQLLGIERIGLREDVWTLGWHSLLATQALARLRDTFQIELSFRVLLEASTVEQVALVVASACGGHAEAEATAELIESVMAMSDAEAGRLLQQVSEAGERIEIA